MDLVAIFSARFGILVAGWLCFAALLVALVLQVIFGMRPCILCHIQQGLLTLVLCIAFLSCYGPFQHQYRRLHLVMLCLLLMTACVAGYQLLIELQIIPAPGFCLTRILSLPPEDMFATLMGPLTPASSCAKPDIYFMGLSMAAWHLLFTSSLCLFLFICRPRLYAQGTKKR